MPEMTGRDYMIGVSEGIRVKEIKDYFKNEYGIDVMIFEKGGDIEASEQNIVKTGSFIIDKAYETPDTVLIVNGDINGDGRVSVTDLFILKNLIIGKVNLNRSSKMGADTNLDKNITITDMTVLKNLILRTLKTNVGFNMEHVEDKISIQLTEPIEMNKLNDFEIPVYDTACRCIGSKKEEVSKFYSNKDVDIKVAGDGTIIHVATFLGDSITQLLIDHGMQDSGVIALSEYWICGEANIKKGAVNKGDTIATVKGNGKDIKCVLEYALITTDNEEGLYETEIRIADQKEYMYKNVAVNDILCTTCGAAIKEVKVQERESNISEDIDDIEDEDEGPVDIVEIVNNIINTSISTNKQQQQQQQQQSNSGGGSSSSGGGSSSSSGGGSSGGSVNVSISGIVNNTNRTSTILANHAYMPSYMATINGVTIEMCPPITAYRCCSRPISEYTWNECYRYL